MYFAEPSVGSTAHQAWTAAERLSVVRSPHYDDAFTRAVHVTVAESAVLFVDAWHDGLVERAGWWHTLRSFFLDNPVAPRLLSGAGKHRLALPHEGQGWLLTAWTLRGARRALVLFGDHAEIVAARSTCSSELLVRPARPAVTAQPSVPTARIAVHASAAVHAPALPTTFARAVPHLVVRTDVSDVETALCLDGAHQQALSIERAARQSVPPSKRPIPSMPKATRNR